MNGPFQPGGNKPRHHGKRHRDEALHVGAAAPVEPAVAFIQHEGIAGPVLAIDRHHVGVARKHRAPGDGGADGGQQIGLGAGLEIDARRGNAMAGEIVFDEGDEIEVGIAAGGVEGDKLRQQFAGEHRAIGHVSAAQWVRPLTSGRSRENGGISTLKGSPCDVSIW